MIHRILEGFDRENDRFKRGGRSKDHSCHPFVAPAKGAIDCEFRIAECVFPYWRFDKAVNIVIMPRDSLTFLANLSTNLKPASDPVQP